MRAIRPLLVAALFLLMAGMSAAQPKPQEAIVGKWVMTQKIGTDEIRFTLEFAKDNKLKGEATSNFGGKTESEKFDGSYKFLDDKTLEVTVKAKEKEETNKATIKTLNDKELVLYDEKNKMEMKFLRPAK